VKGACQLKSRFELARWGEEEVKVRFVFNPERQVRESGNSRISLSRNLTKGARRVAYQRSKAHSLLFVTIF
jgi:hypothetical protein